MTIAGMLALACKQESTVPFDLADYPTGTSIKVYDEWPGMVKVTRADPADPERILAEGDYKEGKKHGVWIEYDAETLIPTRIQTYYEGQLQGVDIILDNGAVTQKTYYVNGERQGQSILYHTSRKAQEIKTYKKGELDGVVRKYYPTGTLMEEAPYTDGQIDGLARWYDQEGNLKFQYLYEAGKLVDQNPAVEEGGN